MPLHRSSLRLCFVLCAVALVALQSARAGEPAGYYNSVDDSNPTALRATLHSVIDDHTRFPYTASSTDTWDILEAAMEDPNNSSNIIDIYNNASFVKAGGGNSNYDREHSWPSSYGFPDDGNSNYPFTDCHHLFLARGNYNQARSNRPFAYCDSGCTEWTTVFNDGRGGGAGTYPGNSNWATTGQTDDYWEVWNGRKGDIARAMFYMDIRYEGGTHGGTGAGEPDLRLTDNRTLIVSNMENLPVAHMGLLSDLLLWHAQDPVDDRERLRNDVVQSFQGNRNPFVDHPEWADCIYGGDCDGDPPPAVLVWINEIHYDNASNDAGEFVEIAGPAGTVLDGWSLVGYNGGDSMVYKTVPLSGTIPDQQACHGTLAFDFVDLQNGAPDAVALVNSADAVVQFLSYEGVLTAADGPAIGMVSTDISVAESGSTPVGFSLQLGGMGKDYPDFMWQMELDDTPGQPNMNQIFADDECVAGPTTQDIVDYVLRRTDDDTGLDLNDDDQVDAADVVLSIPVP